MSITATVMNDTIKLPEGTHLENGTQVVILTHTEQGPTLGERYAKFIGSLDSGIGDLAINHDHYLYGTPKQQP
ncbi:MAG: hypothetical protein ABL974_18765 [Prosthecobacter sp.]